LLCSNKSFKLNMIGMIYLIKLGIFIIDVFTLPVVITGLGYIIV